MASVIVDLGMALICFAGQCHPALVGQKTPPGEYQLTHYTTTKPGYGGDILVFKHNGGTVLAIHRLYNVASQNRRERIKNPSADQRRWITSGCINVDPVVYEKLVDCCSNATLAIK